MYEMGRLAVEKLLTRLQHPNHPVTQTVFSPRLVQRRTTAGRAAVEAPGREDVENVETGP